MVGESGWNHGAQVRVGPQGLCTSQGGAMGPVKNEIWIWCCYWTDEKCLPHPLVSPVWAPSSEWAQSVPQVNTSLL